MQARVTADEQLQAGSTETAIAETAAKSSHGWALQIGVPGACVLMLVLACAFGPWMFGLPNPNAGNLGQVLLPPGSTGHLLGTDALGNDVLSRCLYGGRVSLEVGLGSVLLGGLVGAPLGLWAGFRGGIIDTVIMRVLDMFLAFPALVLAMAVAFYLGPNERDVIFAIAFFTVPSYARLARAETVGLRESVYIVAAGLCGVGRGRTIARHIAPNVMWPLVTYGLVTMALAMVIEAGLDYLGFGLRPPEPSWGSMIAAGQAQLATDPWVVVFPVLFLFVSVSSFNSLGNAVRRAMVR